MKRLATRCAAMMIGILILSMTSAFAAQLHADMSNSRQAEAVLKSKLDVTALQEIGGIIDNVKGNTVRVYLLPEDFEELRLRGVNLRWVTEEELYPEGRPDPRSTLDEYHNNNEIEAEFIAWQAAYPTLFSYESIGQSVQGRDLWMAKLSDNVTSDEPEVEFKYVATMHGDELVGTENCLNFIDTLLTGYGIDPELTEIMDDFEVFIMPLMNPDGNWVNSRYNANGVDLNRSFPDRIGDSTSSSAGRQPEIAAVMDWTYEHDCVLSANFHGGAVVANYPWDDNYTHTNYVFSPTPENDLFYHVAYTYSSNCPMMFNGWEFPPDGTTNGVVWYIASGTMQDWNYVWGGCKEVTIELSDTKSGPESALDSLWWQNETSMRKYLLEAKEGVWGFVTDASTGDPIRADIMLDDITYITHSTELHGDYHRMFLPGTYTLTFSAPDYYPQTVHNIVVNDGTPTRLDIQLSDVDYPEIGTTPTSIDEPIPVCDDKIVPVTIHNTGSAPLHWSVEDMNGSVLDSRESGLTYSWIDISSVGTEINFIDDDQNLGPYPVGFIFPFYGQDFTTYRISANGWLSFTATDDEQSSYSNTGLPNPSAPENLIAPWWDDLSPQRTGAVVTRYTNNVDSLVISYENVESYSNGGLYNFQMILLASGDILFQYGNMGTNRLTSATIGTQNSDGSEGLQIAYDESFIENSMVLSICSGSIVEFSPNSGTVSALGTEGLTVTFNSCCLPLGLFTTSFDIISDDPSNPVLTIPVTLDVGGAIDPDPVTDLTANLEAGGIRLNWGAITGASTYEIWRGTSPDFDTVSGSMLIEVSGTTYLDNSALDDKLFYFVIAKQ